MRKESISMGKQYEARKKRWGGRVRKYSKNKKKRVVTLTTRLPTPQQMKNAQSRVYNHRKKAQKLQKNKKCLRNGWAAAEYSSAIDTIAENVIGKPDHGKNK